MFTVYSKPACRDCDSAKDLLKSRGLSFEVVNLDVGQTKLHGSKYIERAELLKKFPFARTMPQITKNDSTASLHIGGVADLINYLKGSN